MIHIRNRFRPTRAIHKALPEATKAILVGDIIRARMSR